MDRVKYNTLVEALACVPDPRQKRGQRYSWRFLLSLVAAAVAANQQSAHAITQWIHLNAVELRQELAEGPATWPSESTIKRLLRSLDLTRLERQIERFTQRLAPARATDRTAALQGQALDGKELRGVRAHGRRITLVSLVQHGSGYVLAQRAVARKRSELGAATHLLRRNLRGVVVTMDALLTQRKLARQIRANQGHYLMVVKANQPALYEAIALLFERPPWTEQEKVREYQSWHTRNCGHGRRERRQLECSTALSGYLDWPGVGQVLRRRCVRVNRQTGVVQRQTTYGITSLKPEQAGAAALEALWRGHWTIENRVHRVRDVTLGEDAGQIRSGNAPHVLAALRNALLNLWRSLGWTNIADAVRYYAASVHRALELVGAIPKRL